MRVSQIWVYPVIGWAGLRLPEAQFYCSGIPTDSSFMLVDTDYRCLHVSAPEFSYHIGTWDLPKADALWLTYGPHFRRIPIFPVEKYRWERNRYISVAGRRYYVIENEEDNRWFLERLGGQSCHFLRLTDKLPIRKPRKAPRTVSQAAGSVLSFQAAPRLLGPEVNPHLRLEGRVPADILTWRTLRVGQILLVDRCLIVGELPVIVQAEQDGQTVARYFWVHTPGPVKEGDEAVLL